MLTLSATVAAVEDGMQNISGQSDAQVHIPVDSSFTLNYSYVTTFPPSRSQTNMSALQTCKLYDFLIQVVCMGLLCIFGFFGNYLSMACLMRDKSKTATPFLLVSLEVADTLFLITVLILRVLTSLELFTQWFPNLAVAIPYLSQYIYPCALMAETGTVYLTILVTVNRYISVCIPYQASSLCSIRHARKHVALVAFFSIAYNIPRFFEYDIKQIKGIHRFNQTVSILIPTDLEKSKIYQIIYKNIVYFLVLFLVPLVILIILNCKLVKALRETKKKRATLRGLSNDSQRRSEDDITLILIVVVLVFVVCQTPAMVTQILVCTLEFKQRRCPSAHFYYERFSDLMVVANSSLNFLIYCFCSKKFRQILVMLMCKPRVGTMEQSQGSRYCRSPGGKTADTQLMVPIANEIDASSAV